MFETFGLEHPLSLLVGGLRLARVLMFAFAVVSYVGICACACFLRFARGFDVNDRQLAVNGRQCFLACFARYGRQCFLGGLCANAR